MSYSSRLSPYSTTGGASPAAVVHTTAMPVGLPAASTPLYAMCTFGE